MQEHQHVWKWQGKIQRCGVCPLKVRDGGGGGDKNTVLLRGADGSSAWRDLIQNQDRSRFKQIHFRAASIENCQQINRLQHWKPKAIHQTWSQSETCQWPSLDVAAAPPKTLRTLIPNCRRTQAAMWPNKSSVCVLCVYVCVSVFPVDRRPVQGVSCPIVGWDWLQRPPSCTGLSAIKYVCMKLVSQCQIQQPWLQNVPVVRSLFSSLQSHTVHRVLQCYC